MCDNQCLSFVEFLLGRALKTIFLENYPYSSSFHTEVNRTIKNGFSMNTNCASYPQVSLVLGFKNCTFT
ncbi:MAG: hypothetical protein EWV85_05345 [Microcystis aeruginosa Ma_QC_C_20070703_M131]|uniref:Uncharacterized protein n=1 Tax=Microcystis aeruginosa Ma_QC_C_20070703_M131 TaxID=2486263 RepID=A0A551YDK5_MICAE|nr:MAG: hypothetical protein EWV85_05345 [Microcystis aeruginosa Ma_QC_C_20070703_M131]